MAEVECERSACGVRANGTSRLLQSSLLEFTGSGLLAERMCSRRRFWLSGIAGAGGTSGTAFVGSFVCCPLLWEAFASRSWMASVNCGTHLLPPGDVGPSEGVLA